MRQPDTVWAQCHYRLLVGPEPAKADYKAINKDLGKILVWWDAHIAKLIQRAAYLNWPDHERDLKHLSTLQPRYLFSLDIWDRPWDPAKREYFFDGKMQTVWEKSTFADFNLRKAR